MLRYMDQVTLNKHNLNVIKLFDPYIKDVVKTGTHVELYVFDFTEKRWNKSEVRGQIFIYGRQTNPAQCIFIYNEQTKLGFIEPIEVGMVLMSEPKLLMYKKTRHRFCAIAFVNADECNDMGNLIRSLMNQLTNEVGKTSNPYETAAPAIYSAGARFSEEYEKDSPTMRTNGVPDMMNNAEIKVNSSDNLEEILKMPTAEEPPKMPESGIRIEDLPIPDEDSLADDCVTFKNILSGGGKSAETPSTNTSTATPTATATPSTATSKPSPSRMTSTMASSAASLPHSVRNAAANGDKMPLMSAAMRNLLMGETQTNDFTSTFTQMLDNLTSSPYSNIAQAAAVAAEAKAAAEEMAHLSLFSTPEELAAHYARAQLTYLYQQQQQQIQQQQQFQQLQQQQQQWRYRQPWCYGPHQNYYHHFNNYGRQQRQQQLRPYYRPPQQQQPLYGHQSAAAAAAGGGVIFRNQVMTPTPMAERAPAPEGERLAIIAKLEAIAQRQRQLAEEEAERERAKEQQQQQQKDEEEARSSAAATTELQGQAEDKQQLPPTSVPPPKIQSDMEQQLPQQQQQQQYNHPPPPPPKKSQDKARHSPILTFPLPPPTTTTPIQLCGQWLDKDNICLADKLRAQKNAEAAAAAAAAAQAAEAAAAAAATAAAALEAKNKATTKDASTSTSTPGPPPAKEASSTPGENAKPIDHMATPPPTANSGTWYTAYNKERKESKGSKERRGESNESKDRKEKCDITENKLNNHNDRHEISDARANREDKENIAPKNRDRDHPHPRHHEWQQQSQQQQHYIRHGSGYVQNRSASADFASEDRGEHTRPPPPPYNGDDQGHGEGLKDPPGTKPKKQPISHHFGAGNGDSNNNTRPYKCSNNRQRNCGHQQRYNRHNCRR